MLSNLEDDELIEVEEREGFQETMCRAAIVALKSRGEIPPEKVLLALQLIRELLKSIHNEQNRRFFNPS